MEKGMTLTSAGQLDHLPQGTLASANKAKFFARPSKKAARCLRFERIGSPHAKWEHGLQVVPLGSLGGKSGTLQKWNAQ